MPLKRNPASPRLNASENIYNPNARIQSNGYAARPTPYRFASP
jgi:hypothetical protein